MITPIFNIYYELRNEKVSDYDFEPLSVTMKGIVPQLTTAAKSDDHSNRKLVKKDDFVINSRSDRRGSCGISPLDGSVSGIEWIGEIPVDISHILGNLITVISDYQIPHKPLKILSWSCERRKGCLRTC